MDDNLVGGYLERVQHEGGASFLYHAGIAFNFANVFTGGGGVDFHHVSFHFNFIKFLVHHHDSDDKSGLGVKLNYFC
jgi:hypothetical protein